MDYSLQDMIGQYITGTWYQVQYQVDSTIVLLKYGLS